ncbi:MAG: fused MFS/spermidine synthase [Planctomycetota bacterium]|nr:fused MFS/spermidine synthase [Planctomycetota bacterium]
MIEISQQPDTSDQHRPFVGDLLIYFVFFLSGAAALVYEISWARQVGLLFGHTIHAAGVVLASYFFGMAVGYLVGARWSLRIAPLYGYAIAEAIVVAWAFLIPVVLDWSEGSLTADMLTHSSVAVQTLSRVLFSFFLLLPATVALGITLPMIAMVCSSHGSGCLSDARNTMRVTWAYAINTTGALVGVLVATFYLLITVGVTTSSYLAAGLSLICCLIAIGIQLAGWCPLSVPLKDRLPQSSKSVASVANHQEAAPVWLLLGLAALSGFGTLGLQVFYTRMFSLVFHNSSYTFGVVIAVFLAALALGAAIVGAVQRRVDAWRLAGWVTGFGALATVFSVSLFILLTNLEYFSFGRTFWSYVAGVCGLVSLVVGPPVLLLGMLLPLVWKMEGGEAGRVVGWLTAINTLAAALGALLASFVILPLLGLWMSMTLMAGLFACCSLCLLWRSTWSIWLVAGGLLFLGLAGLALRYPLQVEAELGESKGERVIQRWNSPYGWIDVVQVEGSPVYKIRQNLHYRFGKTGSNTREFRQAHIPLMLHSDPQDVLFLGLGTGLTAGGSIPHESVQQVDLVELIPEVVEACRLLADHNFNVIDHSRVDVFVDDARHYLLGTERQYDVIVSDLFVPWESESGYLYTVEHYEVARQRLKPGGRFCQWLPLFQLGEGEFEAIADSFASVFPHVTIWWAELGSSKPVVALIGSDEPLEVSSAVTAQRLESLWKKIGKTDSAMQDVGRFWDLYVGDWHVKQAGPLNTDEHPRVEFATPVSNRQRQLLSSRILWDYYNRVLGRLPRRDAVLLDPPVPLLPEEQQRSRQRLMIFGQ